MNEFDDSLEGSVSKPIAISPEDLRELESVQGITRQDINDPEALRVLDFMKTRNVTTRKLLEVKLNLGYRTAGTLTDKLVRAHLIEKNYALIKGQNGSKVKTSVFTVIKNGRKRNSKKI